MAKRTKKMYYETVFTKQYDIVLRRQYQSSIAEVYCVAYSRITGLRNKDFDGHYFYNELTFAGFGFNPKHLTEKA